VRLDMIVKTIDFPMEFHKHKEKGYTSSRISESANISNLFSPSVITILVGFFDLFFSLVMIFQISTFLSLLVLAFIPVHIIIFYIFSFKIKSSSSKLLEDSASLSELVFETMNAIEEIKVLDIKDKQITNILERINKVVKSSFLQSKVSNLYSESTIFLSSLVGCGLLFSSGLLIINSQL
ncbi:hypothetical protein GNF78_15390, partial [Clostridium perfringens]